MATIQEQIQAVKNGINYIKPIITGLQSSVSALYDSVKDLASIDDQTYTTKQNQLSDYYFEYGLEYNGREPKTNSYLRMLSDIEEQWEQIIAGGDERTVQLKGDASSLKGEIDNSVESLNTFQQEVNSYDPSGTDDGDDKEEYDEDR